MNNIIHTTFTSLLLLLVGVLGVLLMYERQKPVQTVTIQEPPVVVEKAVTVPVIDTEMVAALERSRKQARHYERLLWQAIQSVTEADSLLRADSVTCALRAERMAKLVTRQEEGLKVAQLLINALNEELSPKEDTGSVRTERYQLDYRIAHSGRIPAGGFRYRMQLFEVPVVPAPKASTRHHSAAMLLGLQQGRPSYAVQYGVGGERVHALFQGSYPWGMMSGVGVRW